MCEKCKKYEQFVCGCGKKFDNFRQLTGHQSHCQNYLMDIKEQREKRRLPNGLFKCANPDCLNEHDGSYGNGLFCSNSCRMSFIGKQSYLKRLQRGTFIPPSKIIPPIKPKIDGWKCSICGLLFKTRRELQLHRKLVHYKSGFCSWNKGLTKETDERIRKQGITYSKNLKSGKIKNCWLGKHHTEESKRKIGLCGGYRKGSGIGKRGYYHGIWCDSSWELAWVIYQEEHNVKFTRFDGFFRYSFEGKIHRYHPDFQLDDGTIVEIKGYKTNQWEAKLEQFPKEQKLIVIGKAEIKPYLNYVIEKYGKNFTDKYDVKAG